MKSKRGIPVFMLVAGSLVLGIGGSAIADDAGLNWKNIQLTGFGSYQFGQIEQGEDEGLAVDHFWSHQINAGLGVIADLSDRMKMVVGVQGKMWNMFPPGGSSGYDRASSEQHFSLWLTEASGTYSFGGTKDKPLLQVTGGYFPYKYNSEVRNLGEFLFRSTTYPGLIFNSFDFPAADLLGVKGSINLCDGNWKNDFLVLEQAATWPFGDISMAYVGSYNIGKVIEIGAGIDFASLIPVSSDYTTPRLAANAELNSAGTIVGDTTFYSFTAIKPMAHVTFDPKPLFGDLGKIFGSEDLKVYSEIALIGTKNYAYNFSGIYDSVFPWERMPLMFGFNIPTCGILDVLNLEFEHYACPFVPSDKNQTDPGDAEPNAVPLGWNAAFLNGDLNAQSWKWSIYLKKTITPRVAFTLQFARDHTRLPYEDGYPTYTENLTVRGDWQWIAEFSANL